MQSVTEQLAELKERVRAAAQAAVEAGDALRNRPPMTVDFVETKSAHDFVTQADRDTEELLIAKLSAQYPNDGFLGEESDERKGVDGRWIIDPIDGTTNFIHNLPYYSISIAYERDGELLVGVVYQPATDDLYVAARGMGAFHNGEPIGVSVCEDPSAAVLATSFAHRSPELTARNIRLLGAMMNTINDFRRFGSAALDLCNVACGRLDGYMELDLNLYDIAAGIVILEEAGGQVSGWPGERHCIQTGNVLASNGILHDWLAAEIARHFCA